MKYTNGVRPEILVEHATLKELMLYHMMGDHLMLLFWLHVHLLCRGVNSLQGGKAHLMTGPAIWFSHM